MLQIRSVTKRYSTLTALDGVSLEIGRGEFFGLLGPNGAGKSTLMSLIACTALGMLIASVSDTPESAMCQWRSGSSIAGIFLAEAPLKEAIDLRD